MFLLILIMSNSFSMDISEVDLSKIKLTILYDNKLLKEDLECDWGFSCLIEGAEKTILFDTGTKGSILMSNLKKMNISPEIVDVVVISHDHFDHAGGLEDSRKGRQRHLPARFSPGTNLGYCSMA